MPITEKRIRELTRNQFFSLDDICRSETKSLDIVIRCSDMHKPDVIAFFRFLKVYPLEGLSLELIEYTRPPNDLELVQELSAISPNLKSFELTIYIDEYNCTPNPQIEFFLTRFIRISKSFSELEKLAIHIYPSPNYQTYYALTAAVLYNFLLNLPSPTILSSLTMTLNCVDISHSRTYQTTFIDRLSRFTALKEIKFEDVNYLSNELQRPLGEWIKEHEHLEKIDFSFHTGSSLNTLCPMPIIHALESKSLKHLSISGTVFVESEDYPEEFSWMKLLGDSLKENETLESFQINNMKLYDYDIRPKDEECLFDHLLLPLLQHKTLKTLFFDPEAMISERYLIEKKQSLFLFIDQTHSLNSLTIEGLPMFQFRLERKHFIQKAKETFQCIGAIPAINLIKLHSDFLKHCRSDLRLLQHNGAVNSGIQSDIDRQAHQYIMEYTDQFIGMSKNLSKIKSFNASMGVEIAQFLTPSEFFQLGEVTGGLFFRKQKQECMASRQKGLAPGTKMRLI